MDNVTIGEGVVVQGSVLCNNTKISQKSEFKDCVIGFNQDIITTGKYLSENKNVVYFGFHSFSIFQILC
jgi:NDP-sugar pyrophosphorylase family protein